MARASARQRAIGPRASARYRIVLCEPVEHETIRLGRPFLLDPMTAVELLDTHVRHEVADVRRRPHAVVAAVDQDGRKVSDPVHPRSDRAVVQEAAVAAVAPVSAASQQMTSVRLFVFGVDRSIRVVDVVLPLNSADKPAFNGLLPTSGMANNTVYLLDVAGRRWKKLSGAGPRPRNLYEQTLLVYDSKRDQLILHGSGPRRDELWRFPLSSKAWEIIEPQFAPGTGGRAPECVREAVYLPKDDVMLTAGRPAGTREAGAIWAYHVGENRWYKVDLPLPPGKRANDLIGQNRAWAYDPEHNLVLMVLGDRPGDEGRAQVFALR